MMKRAIQAVLIVAMVFVTTSASAQVGIKLGVVGTQSEVTKRSTYINQHGLGYATHYNIVSGSKEVSIEQIGLLAGINYDAALSGGLSIRLGINYLYLNGETGNERVEDHTLAFPLDLKYAFDLGNERSFYVLAGPRYNVSLAAQNFDLQLGLGAGIKLGILSLEAGYDIGLNQNRNQLALSLGYHF
ncbi:MAG: PorT family protein [Rikenellaceae bacterium]|jgi:hypothetical protein|nr:PorT family protein [Rikenellaceae bacterium]